MLYFVCEIMLKLCVLNVKARLLYYKANLILSLSTCQRTRQNVFEYLLSNNLKIRKESPNSSLEEKSLECYQAPPPQGLGKTEKKNPTEFPLRPPPPKLPKVSVVNKSPNEEELLNQEPSGRNVNIGQYVFNSNLKCWILQNVSRRK